MDKRLGTFVVIDGTETSGKTAQCDLLVQRLVAKGYEVLLLDFPQYDQGSSYFVREYLDGKYGAPGDISPYTTSLFYALDRYQTASAIRKALDEGKVVIANRFTGSSMALQGAKFKHPEERRGFFIWLDNLEFQMLGIPRPDKSVVLRAQQDNNGGTPDTTEAYDDLCNLFPKDFYRIDCARGGKALSTEVIQDTIWNAVEPLLSPSKGKRGSIERASTDKPAQQVAKKASSFYSDSKYEHSVPPDLSKEVSTLYSRSIDGITQLHSKMLPNLVKHLSTTSETPKPDRDSDWETDITRQAIEILDAVLPIAVAMQVDSSIVVPSLESLIDHKLPIKGHSDDYSVSVRLARFHPRNELDLVPDLLYRSSQLSMDEVAKAVSKFTYAQKEQALLSGAKRALNSDMTILPYVNYTWDLLTSVKDQILVISQNSGQVTKQILSPRYGYDMPKVIEEADLVEDFEKCFDLSLKLHSLLQSKGYESEAQYATLLGHKTRWKLSCGLQEVLDLKELRNSHELVQEMLEKITEVHPLISQAVLFVNKEKIPS